MEIINNNITVLNHISSLVESYQNRLRQMKIDQRTDDAMTTEEYNTVVWILEGVIRDLEEFAKTL